MNKKLIAVAVAGALGAPGVALAQASTVQLYGLVVVNYNYLDAGGATPPNAGTTSKVKTDVLNAHDAHIGFKGEERLGRGLTAWFQCENTLDATGASARALGADFCGRNSAIGMKGSFGNVYLGLWDTPMKIITGNFRPFSTAGAYGVTMLWNGTQSNVVNAGTSFTRRQGNLISYQLPTGFMPGFDARIAFSAANEATASTSASTATKPRLWSVGGTYTNGPLILGAGYETHRNYNPAAAGTYAGGTDRGWTLGGAYTFMGTLKASAIVTTNKYEINQTAAGAGTVDQRAWGIYADWAVQGPHRIRAGYTRAGDTSGTAGTLAAPINVANMVANASGGQTAMTLWALQYAHNFSKRTELNFGYARVTNSTFSSIPLQSLGVRNTGQDQSAWVLGTRHSF